VALCACGCGIDAGVYSADCHSGRKGKPKKFINGHARKGFRATVCVHGHPRIPENLTKRGSCKLCRPANRKRHYDKNPEKYKAKRRQFRVNHPNFDKEYNRKVRQEVLDHYGNKCTCCGESLYEFLAFDHIEGGGSKTRRETGIYGSKFTLWLRKNNFPEGFRILCHNCNVALGLYGYCPHQRRTQ
jgi:hypothetical protein